MMSVASVPSDVRKQKLEAWLTEYGDAVLRTCFLYLADRMLAEDALQDTFVKVWRGMERFEGRGGCSVKTWIIRIAINTCKDYRRTAWLRHIDRSKSPEDVPTASGSAADESRALYLDVIRLPAKLKQVVLLYHYHDMTMAEAAETLHISRSAVQHRLQKAYELLRCAQEGSDTDEAERHDPRQPERKPPLALPDAAAAQRTDG